MCRKTLPSENGEMANIKENERNEGFYFIKVALCFTYEVKQMIEEWGKRNAKWDWILKRIA